MNLTAKQALFVKEYLVDLNATQAAIRAGYSAKTAKEIGCENLTKPNIAKAVQDAMDKRSEKTGITAEYVLGTIKETVERCLEHELVRNHKGEPVTVESEEGEMQAVFSFKENGVLKGCELLGKHLKLFTDKVEHTGENGGPIQTENTTDVEIARSIAYLLNKGVDEVENQDATQH